MGEEEVSEAAEEISKEQLEALRRREAAIKIKERKIQKLEQSIKTKDQTFDISKQEFKSRQEKVIEKEKELNRREEQLKKGIKTEQVKITKNSSVQTVAEEADTRISKQLGKNFEIETEIDFEAYGEDSPLSRQTVKSNNEHVGFINYIIDPGDNVYIDNVYIKEKFRKKGMGSKLIKNIEKIAKESGAKISSLEVEEDGLFVWGKLGYKMTNREEFAKIVQLAKRKNIKINSEADFFKIKEHIKEFDLQEVMMQKIL